MTTAPKKDAQKADVQKADTDQRDLAAERPDTGHSEPVVTPAGEPTENAIRDAEIARVPVTPGADENTVPLGDAEPVDLDEDRPITAGDLAALQGIGIAPDRSLVRALSIEDAHKAGVFVSEGMRNDIIQQGWCRSPLDGTVIATPERLEEARKARDERAAARRGDKDSTSR
jgi:hypothetical protein